MKMVAAGSYVSVWRRIPEDNNIHISYNYSFMSISYSDVPLFYPLTLCDQVKAPSKAKTLLFITTTRLVLGAHIALCLMNAGTLFPGVETTCLQRLYYPMVRETGSVSPILFSSLRLQVKHTQLGPIYRASPYLRTPVAEPESSSSWRQAPWDSRPIFFLTKHLRLYHLLWKEDGSVIYNCCWSSPAQSFSGPSPAGLMIIFYSLRLETSPTWRARSPYLYPQEQGGPVISPGTGFNFRRFLRLSELR
jgi:hypothetical protein